MSSPADFYTVYPQALHFKPWFDELFEYILDPALKPEPEEDAAPAEVVATEATEAPKNGRGKGRAKVVETHQ
jgi:hypothetical protein